MSYKQLKSPITSVEDYAYNCLKHTRLVFGVGAVHATAWEAWVNTEYHGTHESTLPTDIAVPVWFEWWGTVNGVYKNWGHVVVNIPGKGLLSSPKTGYGQHWYKSIHDVEKSLGARFAGWSLDVNGVFIAEKVGGDENMVIYIRRGNQSKVWAYNTLTRAKRAIDTWEWNVIQAACRAGSGGHVPVVNVSDVDAKRFGI